MDTGTGIVASFAKRFGCSAPVAAAGLLAGMLTVAGPAFAAKGNDPASSYDWERVTYDSEQVLVVPRVYDIHKADDDAPATATGSDTANPASSSLAPSDANGTSRICGIPVIITVPAGPMPSSRYSRWRVLGVSAAPMGAAFVPSSPRMLPPGPVILPPGSAAFPPLPGAVTTMGSTRTIEPGGVDVFHSR